MTNNAVMTRHEKHTVIRTFREIKGKRRQGKRKQEKLEERIIRLIEQTKKKRDEMNQKEFDGLKALKDELAKMELFNRYYYRGQAKFDRFDLSIETFMNLVQADCHYCGSPPKSKHRGFMYNGIDRIDNLEGYQVGNVVTCCWQCNKLKGGRNIKEFLEQVKEIAKHQQGKSEQGNQNDR